MGTCRSRRDLLTAAGAAMLLVGCGDSGREPPRERRDPPDAAADLAILRFALTLEYLAADFYDRLAAGRLLQTADQDVVMGLLEDEEKHIEVLESLVEGLGGRAPDRPLPDFDRLLSGGPGAILTRAAEIENIGAEAYLGQVARVQDDEALDALLRIHSVEGRHAAGLNQRVGRSFAPDGALARPLAAAAAQKRLAGFAL